MEDIFTFSLYLISHNITGYEYRKAMWEWEWEEHEIMLANDLYEHSAE